MKTESLIQEVFGAELANSQVNGGAQSVASLGQNLVEEQKMPESAHESRKEELIFDFTSAFKADTKAGRKMKKKGPPALSS